MPSVAETLGCAVRLHRQGRLEDAERIYRSLVRIDPKQPDALHLLGVVQQQRGRSASAVDYIARALRQLPTSAVYHSNLAAAYRSLGDLNRAAECLREAVRLDPDFADAHYNLGTVLRELGRPQAAIEAFQKALRLGPASAEALNNFGLALAETGRTETAIDCYRRALAADPRCAAAHNNLGTALVQLGRHGDAKACYEQALCIAPRHRDALFNLGNWHRFQGDPVAAESLYRRALDSDPHNAAVINNLGVSLKEQGRYDEAMRCYDRSAELAPQHAEPHVNRSFLYRLLGDFPRGWEDYDWRLKAEEAPSAPRSAAREWDGSSLQGKRLLIRAEQGIGDQIMFAACLPEVAERAARVILECDPRLAPLLRRSFPQVQIIPQSAEHDYPPHDVQVHCGGLLPFLRTTVDDIPPIAKYLVPEEDRVDEWRRRYAELPGAINVGLSWFGGKDAILQRQRSIPAAELKPMLEVPGANFVNLQYGEHRAEAREVEAQIGRPIHDFDDADPLHDLDGFAAQIAALDLVISIDNSTVHFAGGLGVPCWTLLPFVPDWRWLRDRDDTPWYPSLRLFRQRWRGDWRPVIERVRDALRRLVPQEASPIAG